MPNRNLDRPKGKFIRKITQPPKSETHELSRACSSLFGHCVQCFSLRLCSVWCSLLLPKPFKSTFPKLTTTKYFTKTFSYVYSSFWVLVQLFETLAFCKCEVLKKCSMKLGFLKKLSVAVWIINYKKRQYIYNEVYFIFKSTT